MPAASIKGSIIAPMVEDLRALLDGGRVREADLEARLGSDALRLLDTKINPSDWIELGIYSELATVLAEFEGRSDPHYMHRRGIKAGERIAAAGLYRQLTFVERGRTSHESMDAYLSDLRIILSLQAALVTAGRWEVAVDEDHADRAMVVVHEADGLPEPLVQAMAGFFEGISARAHESGIGWRAERLPDGTVRFRMDRGIGELD